MNIRHYIDFSDYKSSCSSFYEELIGFNYKNNKKLKTGRKGNISGGFTLFELMGALAIIGILSAVAIPNFIAYRDKAFCSAAENDGHAIIAELSDYFATPSHTSMGELPAGIANNGDLLDGKGPTGLKFNTLSGNNIAQLEGDISNIRISVLDASDRCPQDYIDSSHKWSNEPCPSTLKSGPPPPPVPPLPSVGKYYCEQYQ